MRQIRITLPQKKIEDFCLKWKISKDQYRVIFSDLSARDVTAEQLKELEK
jgi:hypothetical protein